MKQYPSISNEIVKNKPIYAFDKLDGSNIRAEWSKKRGFYKFGARKRLLDPKEPILGKAVELILEKYSEDLTQCFKKYKQQKAVCFFEFWGPNSFAGFHASDDQHTVTLFDISFQKGILEPKEFLNKFGHLDTPELLYQGKVNQEFIDSVRGSFLEGMTHEGVVCKGKYTQPGNPLMFKIKSKSWLTKLKHNSDLKEEERLSAQDITQRLLGFKKSIEDKNEEYISLEELLEEFDGWFPTK